MLPDLVIVLMVKPDEGLARIKNNLLRDFNRLDQEKIEMHNKVYEGYRQIIDENRNRTIIEIDASKDLNEVFNDA
jgi:dTMP kinase